MTQYDYAIIKARDTIDRLIDEAMADTKLTQEQNLIYWQILRDLTAHTVKELEDEQ